MNLKNRTLNLAVSLAIFLSPIGYCGVGGHISWYGTSEGNDGSGIATLNLPPPSQKTSSASISQGNVWVSESPDEYDVDSQCIAFSGSLEADITYKVHRGGAADNEKVVFSSDFFLSNAHLDGPGVSKAMDAVTINSIDTSSLKVTNQCADSKTIKISRVISVGENHWDLYLSGEVPYKSQCSLSTDALVDLGDIAIAELSSAGDSLLFSKQKELPVKWQCTETPTKVNLTLSTSKSDGACIGTDNDSLRYCIFRNQVAIDMTNSTSSVDVAEDQGDTVLTIIPGAGKTPVIGKSQGVMVMKIEPE
ncbi:hypothetical protein [Lonsdalea quercina]|uniref:hypothetical protein n=1 Tax=Lonsdalea quercina TaxID=71657 RepID=UPI0039772000